jgi:hypothetical protein
MGRKEIKCLECGKDSLNFGYHHCESCYKKFCYKKKKNQHLKIKKPFLEKMTGAGCCKNCKKEVNRKAFGLCNSCYIKLRDQSPEYKERRRNYSLRKYRERNNLPLDMPIKEKKGFFKNSSGYIYLCKKGHKNANAHSVIAEHTFVMSEFLGRPLKKGESVHHKNGIRHDNRIENLELWHKTHPPGQRLEDKLEWARNLLKEYENENATR